jgi:hypothetical protein
MAGKEKPGYLIKNLSDIVLDILNKLDDSTVSQFISKKFLK